MSIIFLGCQWNKGDFIKDIVRQCDIHKNDLNYVLVLTDFTKFKWDKMYTFGQVTSPETISKSLGFEYMGDFVPDHKERVIFTLAGEIVYEEDYETYDLNNSTIEFRGPQKINDHFKGKYYWTPAKARFKIKKIKDNDTCNSCFNYDLILIQDQ